MTAPAERARRRVAGDEEYEPELEEPKGLRAPYARDAIEYLAVALFAGVVLAILGLAAAVVFWAWTA